jgi:hypothetical protein
MDLVYGCATDLLQFQKLHFWFQKKLSGEGLSFVLPALSENVGFITRLDGLKYARL